jgi:hypothetical protein
MVGSSREKTNTKFRDSVEPETRLAGPATHPLFTQAQLRDPLMFPPVAASQPITGHMIFVAEHAATLSRSSVPQHLCPSACRALGFLYISKIRVLPGEYQGMCK